MAFNSVGSTSVDHGHKHNWSRENEYTTIVKGHKHKVDVRLMLALEAKGHTHRLITN